MFVIMKVIRTCKQTNKQKKSRINITTRGHHCKHYSPWFKSQTLAVGWGESQTIENFYLIFKIPRDCQGSLNMPLKLGSYECCPLCRWRDENIRSCDMKMNNSPNRSPDCSPFTGLMWLPHAKVFFLGVI